MRWWTVSIVLVLAGCSSSGERAARPLDVPKPTTGSDPAVVVSPTKLLVPEVRRLRRADARARLELAGLVARMHPTDAACPPFGVVTGQHPRPGRGVAAGRVIDLWVTRPGHFACGLGLPAAPEHLESPAEAFLAFARHPRAAATPPLAQRVFLLLGNRLVRSVSRRAANRPAAWLICPKEGYYASRTCPFSALRPWRFHLGPAAVTIASPSHPCAHPSPLPVRLRGVAFVTVTADEPRSCVDYFAVQLFIRGGHIVGVNLVWSDP